MIFVFIGILILIFALGCFIVSFFMFLKYLYLIYFKKDTEYQTFLKWFNIEYKNILN